MATKREGGGGKALVVGPLVEELFLWLPLRLPILYLEQGYNSCSRVYCFKKVCLDADFAVKNCILRSKKCTCSFKIHRGSRKKSSSTNGQDFYMRLPEGCMLV